jgi:hypothetical protein
MVYYTGNWHKDVMANLTQRQSEKLFAKMQKIQQDGVTGTTTYTYRVAQMDTISGKISTLTTPNTDDHRVTQQVSTDLMNNVNYNRIKNLSRASTNHVILLYRQIGGSGNFNLVNIYGNDELGSTATSSISVEDYGLYDKTSWGSYSGSNGVYNSRINPVYIPLTDAERTETTEITRTDVIGLPPVGNSTKYQKGFLETTVASTGVVRTSNATATNSPSYFDIQETRYNASPNIDVSGYDSPAKVGHQQFENLLKLDLLHQERIMS